MPTYKKSKELVSAYNDYKRDSIHGDGIMDDISNFGKKVVGGVKDRASKVSGYFDRVVNMKKEIPPNVKKALDEIGDKFITSARVGRTPVQALVQGALRTVANVPYDNLFHFYNHSNFQQYDRASQEEELFYLEKRNARLMYILRGLRLQL